MSSEFILYYFTFLAQFILYYMIFIVLYYVDTHTTICVEYYLLRRFYHKNRVYLHSQYTLYNSMDQLTADLQ